MVRSSMLQRLNFQPNLQPGSQDPYQRLGEQRFSKDGEVVLFEPHPPLAHDLDSFLLPQRDGDDFCTVVLDLDGTLVHSDPESSSFLIRPGTQKFLAKMAQAGCELVAFTSASQEYADEILDQIDPARHIQHRLYRQHCLPWGPAYLKDLSRLGRPLTQTVIIDSEYESFMLQPDNGIAIRGWRGESTDDTLQKLGFLLEQIAKTAVPVPEYLDFIREQLKDLTESDDGLSPQSDMLSGLEVCQRTLGANYSPFVVPTAMPTALYACVAPSSLGSQSSTTDDEPQDTPSNADSTDASFNHGSES